MRRASGRELAAIREGTGWTWQAIALHLGAGPDEAREVAEKLGFRAKSYLKANAERIVAAWRCPECGGLSVVAVCRVCQLRHQMAASSLPEE